MSRRVVALTPLDQGSTALGVPCALRAVRLADGPISTGPVMKGRPTAVEAKPLQPMVIAPMAAVLSTVVQAGCLTCSL
jgi:hypothetical protein